MAARRYDGLGRVTIETNERNQSRSFYYDVAGRLTRRIDRTRGSLYLEGANVLAQPLTPGLSMVYNSNTLPKPIVVVDTFLPSSSAVPDEIKARLTFNGTAGTTYSYSTTTSESMRTDAARMGGQMVATSRSGIG